MMGKHDAAHALTRAFMDIVNGKKEGEYANIALSGGSSPSVLFSLWNGEYRELILWDKVRFFWVDERMVSPDHEESNYGNAKRELLDKVPLPAGSVHRIIGENDPAEEAIRYSNLVSSLLPVKEGFPVFDLVLLGIGEDGHTSSIFPGQEDLLVFPQPYAPSVNPYSGQRRVAMTGNTILLASNVVFYLNGSSKQPILEKVMQKGASNLYPAAWILEKIGKESVFHDQPPV
jgi:6-phosphogluconolactonase